MRVIRFTDAGAFLATAGSWLASDEVVNNVMLTIARSVADGTWNFKEPAYFAAVMDDSKVDCCGSRTPPHRLLVTDGTSRGWAALAADALAACGQLPGVVGAREAAAGFARAWMTLTSARATITMKQRLHSLAQLNGDLPASSGALRDVNVSERALAIEWALAFAREAIPDAPNEAEATVDRHLKYKTLFFWDDGGPVSMCASPGGTGSVARINLVYTPVELRGRGYATASVAALTRRLLNDHRYCCLYTDLANPVSNSIYHRIGYRPVCDVDQYTFTAIQREERASDATQRATSNPVRGGPDRRRGGD